MLACIADEETSVEAVKSPVIERVFEAVKNMTFELPLKLPAPSWNWIEPVGPTAFCPLAAIVMVLLAPPSVRVIPSPAVRTR